MKKESMTTIKTKLILAAALTLATGTAQAQSRTYNYNCTGCYSGSGPYDSAIAVTGIAAGAGIISQLIGAATAPRQVYVQQPVVVYQQPVYRQPVCGNVYLGSNQYGPITQYVCQ